VPETKIDIPEVQLDGLVKEINLGLNKIRTNSVTRPLAVRLSDGQKWLKEIIGKMENMSTTLAGFSDQIRLRGKTGGIINPATEETVGPAAAIVSGTVAMTGSPVQLTATSTACREVWVSADLGAANPIAVGSSNANATDGAWKGLILVPGNSPVSIKINDLSKLYADGTSGDDLSYAYLT